MIRASFVTKLTDFFQSQFKKFSRKSYFELNQKLDQDFVFGIISAKRIPSMRQLKYIGKFYSDAETLITKISLFLALASCAFLGIVIYKNNVVTQPSVGGEYVEAVIGAPTYINPLFSQTNDVDRDLSQILFSKLMKLNESGQLIGDLAESYEIDESQTTYTFKLKKDVKWHDGEDLTADDIVFTVQSIQDQNFKSPLYITFRNVQVRKIDERTISFTLAEAFAPFLSVMTFGILPEHLWQEIDPSHAILAELNLKPIGSGPYKFASFTKDKKGNIRQYSLERFKDYYENGPFIEKLSLKFFADFQEAQTALNDGNVDGIGFLPSQQAYKLSGSMTKEIKTNKFSLPQYTALFFNQASNPVLSEKSVRQALSLSASKHKIIESAFHGVAEPVDAPIPKGMIGYTEDIPVILHDPAQAEKILDDALWDRIYEDENQAENSEAEQNESEQKFVTRGSGALGLDEERKLYSRHKTIKKGGKTEDARLEITLTTIQRDDMMRVAETIRELWQNIGVKVNLQIVDIGKIQKEVIKPRAYEVLLFGQILGADPDPYPFWHSSQSNDPGLNLAMYSNKEADRLLEDARRTTAESERQEKYEQFQQKLLEDVPAIFLYSLQYSYLTPVNIKGISTQNINHQSDRFSNINSWYIKTKKRLQF